MKAIIIGAGRGKRLQHFTDDIPKTMVPIVGRPMIEHVLSALEAGGLTADKTVVVGIVSFVLDAGRCQSGPVVLGRVSAIASWASDIAVP